MGQNKAKELLEELEDQFHSIQAKIAKAKDSYLNKHHKEHQTAQLKYTRAKKKVEDARKKVARDASKLGKSGTQAAQNQLKKTKAAAALLGESLGEARDIMATTEGKLSNAKPFEKKLAARAKALAAFEKDWEMKQKAADKAKVDRAKKRKSEAKKKKAEAKSAA
jgi:hypothetical protein